MERLYIPATLETPLVDFNPDGNLWIKGRAYPVDGPGFFEDIINWFSVFCTYQPVEIVLNIEISYHNDTFSKYMLSVLQILKKNCATYKINWYYEEWDDDILFLGEMLSAVSGVDFTFCKLYTQGVKR